MKYIGKVRKINADEELYIAGVSLELTNIEFLLIKESLEIATSTKLDNLAFKEQLKKTLAKFNKVEELMNKGFFIGENTEID